MGPWLCVFHLSEEFCSTSLRIESFSTSDRFVPPPWESQPHQCWKLILPRSKRHRKKSTLDIQRLIQGIATFGNKNEINTFPDSKIIPIMPSSCHLRRLIQTTSSASKPRLFAQSIFIDGDRPQDDRKQTKTWLATSWEMFTSNDFKMVK